jgi:hypothetical protein
MQKKWLMRILLFTVVILEGKGLYLTFSFKIDYILNTNSHLSQLIVFLKIVISAEN